MIGPKTVLELQRRVTTQTATGSQSAQWVTVATFDAVLIPKRANEIVFADKETIFADWQANFDYFAPGYDHLSEVKESNRIRTDDDTFDIRSVQNHQNRMWRLELLKELA